MPSNEFKDLLNRVNNNSIITASDFDREESANTSLSDIGYSQNYENSITMDKKEFKTFTKRDITPDPENISRSIDLRAQAQTTVDQWANGLVKFGGKTGLAVAGALGTLGAIPSAIASGEFSSVYDNDYQKALDKGSEWFDDTFRNYYTKKEQDKNLFGSLGTANFWANDVLGALSFTAGAVLTELGLTALTGTTAGAAAPIQAAATLSLKARAIKIMKSFKDLGTTIKNINTTSAGLKIGRQLITGAGYEAGVEARHFKEEAINKYIQKFQQDNGREPSTEELAEVEDYTNKRANYLFAANMALVGAGNAIQFPKLFGPAPKPKLRINTPSSLLRDKATSAIKPDSKLTKGLKIAGLTMKNPLYEGFVEEGGQSVFSKTGEDLVLSKFNTDGTQNAVDLISSLHQGFEDTYGTKEGMKEVLIGAIVGGIGAPIPGTGQKLGILEGLNEYNKNRAKEEEISNYQAETYNATSFDKVIEQMQSHAANYEINQSENQFSNGDSTYTFLEQRDKLGLLGDTVDEFSTFVENMSEDQFAQEFGYENKTKEELVAAKQKAILDFKNTAKTVTKVRESVKNITVPNEHVRDAIAANLFKIENHDHKSDELVQQIQELSSKVNAKDIKELSRGIASLGGNTKELNKLLKKLEQVSKLSLNEIHEEGLDNATKSAEARAKEVQTKIAKRKEVIKEIKEQLEELKKDPKYNFDALELNNFIDKAETYGKALLELEKAANESPNKSKELNEKLNQLVDYEVSRIGAINSYNNLLTKEGQDNLTTEILAKKVKLLTDLKYNKTDKLYDQEVNRLVQENIARIFSNLSKEEQEKLVKQIEENKKKEVTSTSTDIEATETPIDPNDPNDPANPKPGVASENIIEGHTSITKIITHKEDDGSLQSKFINWLKQLNPQEVTKKDDERTFVIKKIDYNNQGKLIQTVNPSVKIFQGLKEDKGKSLEIYLDSTKHEVPKEFDSLKDKDGLIRIGGLLDPQRFLLNDMELDFTNPVHLKELNSDLVYVSEGELKLNKRGQELAAEWLVLKDIFTNYVYGKNEVHSQMVNKLFFTHNVFHNFYENPNDKPLLKDAFDYNRNALQPFYFTTKDGQEEERVNLDKGIYITDKSFKYIFRINEDGSIKELSTGATFKKWTKIQKAENGKTFYDIHLDKATSQYSAFVNISGVPKIIDIGFPSINSSIEENEALNLQDSFLEAINSQKEGTKEAPLLTGENKIGLLIQLAEKEDNDNITSNFFFKVITQTGSAENLVEYPGGIIVVDIKTKDKREGNKFGQSKSIWLNNIYFDKESGKIFYFEGNINKEIFINGRPDYQKRDQLFKNEIDKLNSNIVSKVRELTFKDFQNAVAYNLKTSTNSIFKGKSFKVQIIKEIDKRPDSVDEFIVNVKPDVSFSIRPNTKNVEKHLKELVNKKDEKNFQNEPEDSKLKGYIKQIINILDKEGELNDIFKTAIKNTLSKLKIGDIQEELKNNPGEYGGLTFDEFIKKLEAKVLNVKQVTTSTPNIQSDIEAKKADIEKIQETNNKNEKFWEQFTAINAEEVADRDNLINKLTKDIKLPVNTRINNWVLEELNGKLWEGKNIRGKEEEYFGKENWDKIKEAKNQFDIEFKKIEDSNLAKIKLIEQKQSDLLSTIDGLELRKAWSFGLIEEPNVVGLDETNFISKKTEFKNGDLVETDNYEGYYYLSKPNKDDEWYEQIIGKTEQEVEDKINAKYDAELKALKDKKSQAVTTNVESEKAKKTDIERRKGVSELFESNPELANQVYEALGFKEKYEGAEKGDLINELQQITDPYLKEFANLFIQSNINIPLYYSKGNDYSYVVPDNTLIISKNSFGIIKQKSIIHEVLHGGTTNNLLSNSDFKNRIEAIINNIKKSDQQGRITFSYELQSADEFISGLADKAFGAYLKRNGVFDELFVLVKDNISFEKGFKITPQQKQEALQIYSSYLDTIFNGGKQDIEGFKNFVKSQNNNQILGKKQKMIKPGVEELFDSNPELANAVYEALGVGNLITPNDKIIWGHPAIGKSYAAKKVKMIDFDSYKLGINKKYNLYIAPGLSDTELRTDDKTREARENWRYESEENQALWNQFIRDVWQQAKKDAKEQGAILFASDLLVLREFGNEVDKALTMPDELFFERSKQRNNFIEGELGTKVWKGNLNKAVNNFKEKFGESKVINTEKYLSDLFITPQQKQQALQLYSQYLDTIFPDSKVKDIVYHGTDAQFDKFDKSKISKTNHRRFYFSPINTNRYGQHLILAMLDIKNLAKPGNDKFINDVKIKHPEYTEGKSEWFHLPAQIYANADEYGYDGVYNFEGTNDDEYSVYEPEQIHILGSKQDIDGFKKFVAKYDAKLNALESIPTEITPTENTPPNNTPMLLQGWSAANKGVVFTEQMLKQLNAEAISVGFDNYKKWENSYTKYYEKAEENNSGNNTEEKPKDQKKRAFSFNTSSSELLEEDINSTIKELSRILNVKTKENPNGDITVEEFETLTSNMSSSNIPIGLVFGSTLSLAKKRTHGVKFHEAFHIVFRNYFTDSQITNLLNKAKEQWKHTDNDIKVFDQKLRANDIVINNDQELIDLWYEEKLADSFEEYTKNNKTDSWLKKAWLKLKQFINKLFKNNNLIQSTFYDIQIGKYKNAKRAYSIYTQRKTPAPKLIEVEVINQTNGKLIKQTLSKKLSELIINEAALIIFNNRSNTRFFTDDDFRVAIKYLQDKYSTDTFEDITRNVFKLQENLNLIQVALSDVNSLKLIREEVKHSLKIFNINEGKINPEKETEQELSEDETSAESWRLDTAEVGGYDNLSKRMRGFFKFTEMYLDTFNLGFTETEIQGDPRFKTTINSYEVYSGIERVLANTPKELMFKKLNTYAKYNPQAFAVYKSILDQIYIEYTNDPNLDYPLPQGGIRRLLELGMYEEVENSTLLADFIQSFYKIKGEQIFVRIDKATKELDTFNSNSKDVDKLQFERWSNSFSKKNLTKQKVTDVIDEVSILYYENTNDSIESRVDEIRALFLSIGIDLSDAYLTYSLAHLHKNILGTAYPMANKYQVSEYNELVEMFEDSSIPLGLIKTQKDNPLKGETFNILDTTNQKSSLGDGNVLGFFGKETQDGDTDATSTLLYMARENAIFDEGVGSSVFRNAEDKIIFDKLQPSFLLEFNKILKDNMGKIASFTDASQLQDFFEANGYYFDDYKINKLWQVYQYNYFFKNPELLKHSKLGFHDGLAERNIKENEDGERYEDNALGRTKGLSYPKLSSAEAELFSMGLYSSPGANNKEINGIRHAFFQPNIIESKSTAVSILLPVQDFMVNNKLTSSGLEIIKDALRQEFERIQIVQNEEVISEEYHEVKNEDGTIKKGRGHKLFLFKGLDVIEPGIVAALEDAAKSTKKSLDSFTYNNKSVDEILNDYVNKLYEHYLDTLDEIDLVNKIEKEDGTIVRDFDKLPPFFKNNIGELKKYFVNDLLNSLAYNQLIHGDFAMNYKDYIDVTKRNGGLISAGPSLTVNNRRLNTALIKSVNEKVEIFNELSQITNNIDKDTSDGQSLGTIPYLRDIVNSTGKGIRIIHKIYDKIERGIPLSYRENQILDENNATLNPKKIVGRDIFYYLKTSIHFVTREQVSDIKKGVTYSKINSVWNKYKKDPSEENLRQILNLYVPKKGRELLHSFLSKSLKDNIDFVSFDSAVKTFKSNVTNSQTKSGLIDSNIWDNIKIQQISSNIIREQVKTDGFKKTIIDGTQKTQLIWSEQDNTLTVTLNGIETSIGNIQEAHFNHLTDRLTLAQEALEKAIFLYSEAGKITSANYEHLLKSIQESLNSSNADPYIMEMFSQTVDGLPKYNLNLPATRIKFMQMYLAYISSSLKQKAPGTKFTLVSDFGYNYVDETGEVRKLSWGKKDKDGNYYAETIVSEKVLRLYGLKKGDIIPEKLYNIFGIRIPTQDKHSMVRLKIVDFTPEYMGNMIIVPIEVIAYSGADFDIDALYARVYSTYSKGVLYGDYIKEDSLDDAYEIAYLEYVYDSIKNKPIFKSILEEVEENEFVDKDVMYLSLVEQYDLSKEKFLDKYQDIIKSNFENYRKGLFQNIKAITKEEANNLLLEEETILMANDGNINIAKTPSSMDIFKENVKEFFEQNDIPFELNFIDILSRGSKIQSRAANKGGAENIGPAAVYNIVFQQLLKNDPKFSKNQKTKFRSSDAYSIRTNDIISSIISTMTDNAKEQLAKKLNLSIETLPLALVMIGEGIPLVEVLLFMKQPIINRINNKYEESKNRSIKTSNLKGDISEENIVAEALEMKVEDIRKLQKEGDLLSTNETDLIDNIKAPNDDYNLKMALLFLHYKKKSNEIRKFAEVLSIIKGFPSDWHSFNLRENLEELGIDISGSFNTHDNVLFQKNKRENVFNNYLQVINNNKFLKKEIQVALFLEQKSEFFFIEKTNSYKKLFESVLSNMKDSYLLFPDNREVINKALLSYLTGKAFKTLRKSINLPVNFDPENLHNNDLELLSSELVKKYPTNFFLINLNISSYDLSYNKVKKPFQDIQSNNWSNKNSDYNESMINGFRELTIASAIDPQAGLFIKGIVGYLYERYSMQFKNGSYITQIDPTITMLDPANALDAVHALFNEEGDKKYTFDDTEFMIFNYEQILGAPEFIVQKEISELFSRYLTNVLSLRYRDSKDVVNIAEDSDHIDFSTYQDPSTKIKSSSLSIELPFKITDTLRRDLNSLALFPEDEETSLFSFPDFIKIGNSIHKLEEATIFIGAKNKKNPVNINFNNYSWVEIDKTDKKKIVSKGKLTDDSIKTSIILEKIKDRNYNKVEYNSVTTIGKKQWLPWIYDLETIESFYSLIEEENYNIEEDEESEEQNKSTSKHIDDISNEVKNLFNNSNNRVEDLPVDDVKTKKEIVKEVKEIKDEISDDVFFAAFNKTYTSVNKKDDVDPNCE
jgi:hypothetical protein